MKLRNLAVLGSAAALVLALSACGSQNTKVGDKALTQAQADSLKIVAPYLGSALVSGLRGGGAVKASGSAKQGFVSGTCSASTFTDNDNDNIPVNYNASFQDCTEDNFLFILVRNGTVNVNDTNDSDPRSGFTSKATNLAFDFYENKGQGTKGKQFFRIVDNWDVTVGTTATSASVNYKLSVALTSFNNGVQDKTWNGSLAFTGNYTANPKYPNTYSAGTINLNGTLVLGDFAVNQTISNLTFDPSCTAGPNGGKIRFDDGGANFFEVNYTGCNTGTFTYNASGAGTF